jgi:hypothetical protein
LCKTQQLTEAAAHCAELLDRTGQQGIDRTCEESLSAASSALASVLMTVAP